MFHLDVPILVVIIGEGGSGGALGIGVGDRVLMMEYAYYSVISPEGCAAILWHSRDFKAEAAAALKLTSRDLLASGIVEEVIPEPAGGAHSDWDAAAEAVKASLERNLEELLKLDPNDLVEQRWEKYEAIGAWVEDSDQADGP